MSLSWKDGTEYEVKCQQTFAYYTGYVVDYDVTSQKFHVCYENEWKADEQVQLGCTKSARLDVICYEIDCPTSIGHNFARNHFYPLFNTSKRIYVNRRCV